MTNKWCYKECSKSPLYSKWKGLFLYPGFVTFWKLKFTWEFTLLFLSITICLVMLREIWPENTLIIFFMLIRQIVHEVFVFKKKLHYCTDQLGLCEITFPPQVLLHGRNDGQAVVWIHQHMDEAIQCGSKETCTQTMQHISQVIPILNTHLKSYKLDQAEWFTSVLWNLRNTFLNCTYIMSAIINVSYS